jgi:hypothetical protein
MSMPSISPGPAFVLCAGAAVGQVGFEFVEPGEHLGVDVQHRAADVPLTEMILEQARAPLGIAW